MYSVPQFSAQMVLGKGSHATERVKLLFLSFYCLLKDREWIVLYNVKLALLWSDIYGYQVTTCIAVADKSHCSPDIYAGSYGAVGTVMEVSENESTFRKKEIHLKY